MNKIKRVVKLIRFHGKILLKGFLRMMYGAGTAGLFAMAIYGLVMIPTESGWTAICDFVASAATISVAMTCMYAQGAGVKKGAKR